MMITLCLSSTVSLLVAVKLSLQPPILSMEMTWELVQVVLLIVEVYIYPSLLFLTATFPLSIAVSSLSAGDNMVVLSLEGSGSSTATATFTITLSKHIIAA